MDRRFEIIWPEHRFVSEDQIRTWYSDAVANGEAEETDLRDPEEMARELSSIGTHHARPGEVTMGELQEIWDEVAEAVRDALNNGEGRASPWYLEHCFMKAGLAVHRLPDDPPKLVTDVTVSEPTERPFKHVHNWCPVNDLIDRCSVCGEERA